MAFIRIDAVLAASEILQGLPTSGYYIDADKIAHIDKPDILNATGRPMSRIVTAGATYYAYGFMEEVAEMIERKVAKRLDCVWE